MLYTIQSMMSSIHDLFIVTICSIFLQHVRCFILPSLPPDQSLYMTNQLPVSESQDNVNENLILKSSSLDQSRRNAVTTTAAAVLSVPFLLENVDSLPLPVRPGISGSGAVAAVSEALLQGDYIVRSLWLSRLTYPSLIVCLEIGLFEALKDRPLTKKELGKLLTPQLEGSGRALEALVAVMASLELLEIHHTSMISLTESARHVLLRDSPYFWGNQLLAADGTTSALRRAVYTDGKQSGHDFSGHSTEVIDSFIDSMHAHGAVTAQATAQALDPVIGRAAEYPAKHILDMAGGSGCFSTALSDRYGIRVTLCDLPTVVEKWRRQHPFSRKVEAIAADLFKGETWPRTGCDCHLLANVLHDWNKRQVSLILEASCFALRQNKLTSGNALVPNRLIVVEQLLSDDYSGPTSAALASVSMLLVSHMCTFYRRCSKGTLPTPIFVPLGFLSFDRGIGEWGNNIRFPNL
jgi:O-methyltransferase domain